jgi:hypothetical protein
MWWPLLMTDSEKYLRAKDQGPREYFPVTEESQKLSHMNSVL